MLYIPHENMIFQSNILLPNVIKKRDYENFEKTSTFFTQEFVMIYLQKYSK